MGSGVARVTIEGPDRHDVAGHLSEAPPESLIGQNGPRTAETESQSRAIKCPNSSPNHHLVTACRRLPAAAPWTISLPARVRNGNRCRIGTPLRQESNNRDGGRQSLTAALA